MNHYLAECQLPLHLDTYTKAARFVKNICSSYNLSKQPETTVKLKNYNRLNLSPKKKRKESELELTAFQEAIERLNEALKTRNELLNSSLVE